MWTDAAPAGGGLSTGAKVGLGVLAAFVGLCAIGGIGAAVSGGDSPRTEPAALSTSSPTASSATPTDEATEDADKAAADKAAADKAAADAAAAAAAAETVSQKNAKRSAADYLDLTAFPGPG